MRFQILDGWRGISILLVLAAHLLPLGPKGWRLNECAGEVGMSIFFCLSGFLITTFLLRHDDVTDFICRRFFRIAPLAWVGMVIGLWESNADINAYIPHLLFYANFPPYWLTPATAHLWSLCVEVQFYVAIALIFALFGRNGLFAIPFACLAVTCFRAYNGVDVAIVTYYRVDEILSGGILALIYSGEFGASAKAWLRYINIYAMAVMLIAASHPAGGFFNYFRPYFASALVGCTLVSAETYFTKQLSGRVLSYIAAISFALYVIHPLVGHTWLGTGDTLIKYAKRPLLFFVVWASAHLSTFYFESRWIALGKSLSMRLRPA